MVAFLPRLPGNSLVPTYLKDWSSLGRGRAHPLYDFVGLGDSSVISSCSACFGLCPLIQTLRLQLSAA